MSTRQTNTEFVTSLMNFCPKGPLIQPFVMQALISYSEGVLASPHGFMDGHIISEAAWRDLAAHVKQELDKHLSGSFGQPPQQPAPEPKPVQDYKWVAKRMLELATTLDMKVEVYYEDDWDAPADFRLEETQTYEKLIEEMEACGSCSVGLYDPETGRLKLWHLIVVGGGNTGEDTVADYVDTAEMRQHFPEHYEGWNDYSGNQAAQQGGEL